MQLCWSAKITLGNIKYVVHFMIFGAINSDLLLTNQPYI